MTAYFGEPALKAAVTLKAAVMVRLREHRKIVGGGYGIPLRVWHWLEMVFERLPPDERVQWVIDSTEAIPVGADMSRCHHHLAAWLQDPETGILTITDANREAISKCRALHLLAIDGGCVTKEQWLAARSAAWSAAESAVVYSAYLAAYSAAYSVAESVVGSAAYSARSAAYSARSAAYSAEADSAAWQRIAQKSIEIFREAPVVGRSDECEEDLVKV